MNTDFFLQTLMMALIFQITTFLHRFIQKQFKHMNPTLNLKRTGSRKEKKKRIPERDPGSQKEKHRLCSPHRTVIFPESVHAQRKTGRGSVAIRHDKHQQEGGSFKHLVKIIRLGLSLER